MRHELEKLPSPSRLASRMANAVAGAVVSNPTAKKTTSRSVSFWARATGIERRIDNAHVAGRLHARREDLAPSPARAACRRRNRTLPSGRAAISKARSIISNGVTQTGQPGPCTSRSLSGIILVDPAAHQSVGCPPQTSMTVHGRVTVSATWPPIARPGVDRGIRPTYFMAWSLRGCRFHGAARRCLAATAQLRRRRSG